MSEPTRPDSPVIALLERLARTALAARPGVGPVRLAAVEPDADGATLLLRVHGVGGLVNATVPVRLTIQRVEAERTRCRVSLPRHAALGRLIGAGLQRLPPHLLQQVLTRALGDSATLEGDTLILHHGTLLRRLRRREG